VLKNILDALQLPHPGPLPAEEGREIEALQPPHPDPLPEGEGRE
jgi:hypothetical protein